MIMIKHQERIVGWSSISGDAVAASYVIPIDWTVRDAALAFCGVVVEGFAGEEKADVPGWIINLSDPTNWARYLRKTNGLDRILTL